MPRVLDLGCGSERVGQGFLEGAIFSQSCGHGFGGK